MPVGLKPGMAFQQPPKSQSAWNQPGGVKLDAEGNPIQGNQSPQAASPGQAPAPAAAPGPNISSTQKPASNIQSKNKPWAPIDLTGQGFSGPGAAPGATEKYVEQNQEWFGQPSETRKEVMGSPGFQDTSPEMDYWKSIQGKFNTRQDPSKFSEEAYKSFQERSPQDLSAYFDEAQRTASEDLNKQFGSRGMFGSSANLGMQAEMSGGIRAQQAKAQAEHDLQRAKAAGDLAGQADAQERLASADELNWTTGMGNLAFGAGSAQMARKQADLAAKMGVDQADLSKMMAGLSAAELAQTMEGLRTGKMGSEILAGNKAVSDLVQAYQSAQLAGDQATMDTINELLLGWGREAANEETARQENVRGWVGTLFDAGKTVKDIAG
jgi:hypothetical protein